jgi:hypothetical protein
MKNFDFLEVPTESSITRNSLDINDLKTGPLLLTDSESLKAFDPFSKITEETRTSTSKSLTQE